MKAVYQVSLTIAANLLVCVKQQNLPADIKLDLPDTYPNVAAELNKGPSGSEFQIAISPSESQTLNVPTRVLEISVTSCIDTEVTMEVPCLGSASAPIRDINVRRTDDE